jgi:hypothetical protein
MSHSAVRFSHRSLLVVPAVVAALMVGSPHAHAAKLRWKFKEGETLHYQMDQKTVSVAKAEGQESKSTLTQTVNSAWVVHSVAADGSAEMSQTIERLRLKIETPFAKFEFDSAEKKDPAAEKKDSESQIAAQFMPILKAQVGAEFKYKINTLGELSDIRVPKALLAVLNPAGGAGGGGGGGGGMFSEEGLKDMIRESSLTFPADDLAPGKTWKNSAKVAQGTAITIAVEKTYTYRGHKPEGEEVALEVKVTPQIGPNAGVDIKITSQEGKGTFLFDAEKGRVIRSTVAKKLDAVITKMGQQFTQSSDESNTMTLIEGKGSAAK